MSGKTLHDRHEQLSIYWFSPNEDITSDVEITMVMELAIPGTRRRGRPKTTWHQQMKEDMAGVGVTQDVALDRKEWRRRTRPTPTR